MLSSDLMVLAKGVAKILHPFLPSNVLNICITSLVNGKEVANIAPISPPGLKVLDIKEQHCSNYLNIRPVLLGVKEVENFLKKKFMAPNFPSKINRAKKLIPAQT